MGKLEELMARGQGNAAESMGVGVASASPNPSVGGSGPPERLRGLTPRKDVATVPLDKLQPDPEQPREEFDEAELARLADSLREHGQIQPIAAWWDDPAACYRIVAGERRWRAARLAGLETLIVSILPARPEASRLIVLQIAENVHRSDLKPMEQAKTFRKAMALNGWTAAQLSRELAIPEGSVSRTLSLLTLPEPVQAQVEAGVLHGASAYEVSKIADPEVQAEVAARVVSEGLSRAETIEAVKRAAPSRKSGAAKGRGASKPAKLVVKTFRAPNGKVTIELRKGLDSGDLAATLRQVLEMLEPADSAAA